MRVTSTDEICQRYVFLKNRGPRFLTFCGSVCGVVARTYRGCRVFCRWSQLGVSALPPLVPVAIFLLNLHSEFSFLLPRCTAHSTFDCNNLFYCLFVRLRLVDLFWIFHPQCEVKQWIGVPQCLREYHAGSWCLRSRILMHRGCGVGRKASGWPWLPASPLLLSICSALSKRSNLNPIFWRTPCRAYLSTQRRVLEEILTFTSSRVLRFSLE